MGFQTSRNRGVSDLLLVIAVTLGYFFVRVAFLSFRFRLQFSVGPVGKRKTTEIDKADDHHGKPWSTRNSRRQ